MNSTIIYTLIGVIGGNCISGILSIPSFCYLIPVGFMLHKFGLNHLDLLGDLGVLLLFFTIGLELSWHEIVLLSPFFAKVLFLNAALITSLTLCIRWFLPWQTAAILAIIGTLSSTPLILGFLKDNQQSHSGLGYQALALILLQDFISMLLIMYFDHYQTGFNWLILLKFLGNIIIFAVVWFLSKYVVNYFAKFLHNKEHSVKLSGYLSLLLIFAFFSNYLGLSKEFGVLSLGAALANVNHELQIEEYVAMIKTILINCFFISIGSLISWEFIKLHYIHILQAAGLAITIKSLVIGLFASSNSAIKMLLFSNISDVAFILLKPAHTLDIINDYYYNLSISVVVLSLIAFPVILKLGSKLLQHDNQEHYDIVIFGHSAIAQGLAHNLFKRGFSYLLMTPKMQDNIKLSQLKIKSQIGHFTYKETLNTILYQYKPQAIVITSGNYDIKQLTSFLLQCHMYNIKTFVVTNNPLIASECQKYNSIIIGINYDSLVAQSLDAILQNLNNMFLNR